MRKLLIAASTLVCLMATPLVAQAATTSSQPSTSGAPEVSKHATVRHHLAQHQAPRHHTAMSHAKKQTARHHMAQRPTPRDDTATDQAKNPATTGSVH